MENKDISTSVAEKGLEVLVLLLFAALVLGWCLRDAHVAQLSYDANQEQILYAKAHDVANNMTEYLSALGSVVPLKDQVRTHPPFVSESSEKKIAFNANISGITILLESEFIPRLDTNLHHSSLENIKVGDKVVISNQLRGGAHSFFATVKDVSRKDGYVTFADAIVSSPEAHFEPQSVLEVVTAISYEETVQGIVRRIGGKERLIAPKGKLRLAYIDWKGREIPPPLDMYTLRSLRKVHLSVEMYDSSVEGPPITAHVERTVLIHNFRSIF